MVIINDTATAISELQDAIEAIQTELGVNPGGVYADARVRLDILEARINNPFVPAPNVENPFFIGNDGVTISTGFGYPTEDRLDGSLYLRQDGYVYEGLYSRRDGYWKRINTDPWEAAGDLAGVYNFQTVIGLQNRPVSADMPLDGYHLTWNDSLSMWEPQIGFYASNDLSGTKISQTVIGLQGRAIDSTLPVDGYVLTWNDLNNQWQPQASAVVFDDIFALTNIKANRSLEPATVDNTKTGIVNLGSNSSATDDYATVSGGYENNCNYIASFIGGGGFNTINPPASPLPDGGFNTIVGGAEHTIESKGFSSISGGLQNYIDSLASAIIGGGLNTILGDSGTINIIGSGFSNVIDNSSVSSIINGQYNYINSNDSTILNGNGNAIQNASFYSTIINGNNHTVNNSPKAIIISGDTNYIENAEFGVVVSGLGQAVLSEKSSIVNGNNNTIRDTYSTILNGDNGVINASYSTILTGGSNEIDTGADHSIILNGFVNYVSSGYNISGGNFNNVSGSSDFSFVYGTSNALASSLYAHVIGFANNISGGACVNVHGANNEIDADVTYARVFGYNNTVNSDVNLANVFGYSNQVSTASTPSDLLSSVFGKLNVLEGQGSSIMGFNNYLNGDYSHILGHDNSIGSISNPINYGLVHGYNGQARYHGQYVQSTSNLSISPGYSQYSRMIVDGFATAGSAFNLTSFGNNLQFEDGKSYDMIIRVLVVNTNGTPTCARYVYDILAHQESGTLVIDNFNNTILSDNGTGWTVTINAASNQLDITVDSCGVSDRKGMATIEWRELSRV